MTVSIKSPTSTTGSIQLNGSDVLTIDSSGNLTATNNLIVSGAYNATAVGNKNIIINGDMRIDQRNAGASLTLSGSYQYSVDRWKAEYGGSGSSVTLQQSTDAPDSLTNSIKLTIGTGGGSVGASDYLDINQRIEGNNIAHLGFGQSWAKTFTLSFWVKSSVTGTYGVTFRNGNNGRGYRTTYTIDSANTWEQKTLTITADTSGAWATDNTLGLNIGFFLGAGTTYQNSTLNTWDSSGTYLCANTVSNTILTTTGATFYLTGVQLEIGTVATPFEHLMYGTQLALCQRYYNRIYDIWGDQSVHVAGGRLMTRVDYPVQMRATPTVTTNGVSNVNCTFQNSNRTNTNGTHLYANSTVIAGDVYFVINNMESSAEL